MIECVATANFMVEKKQPVQYLWLVRMLIFAKKQISYLQIRKYKGVDKTARIYRLACAIVVCIHQSQGFPRREPTQLAHFVAPPTAYRWRAVRGPLLCASSKDDQTL